MCAMQPLREKTQPPETWVPSRTNSELRQEQLADPSLAKVINWKETSSACRSGRMSPPRIVQ